MKEVMLGFILGPFRKGQEELKGKVKACPYCNATFNNETDLEMHIGRHHPRS